jgi:Putative Ig domain
LGLYRSTVPPGLELTYDGIFGTPTSVGTFGFILLLCDSTGDCFETGALITVLTSLTITTTSLPSGSGGMAYFATLVATGGNPPYKWKLAAGSAPLPKGLARHGRAGVISGRPKKSDNGTYTFTVEVLDKKQHPKHEPPTRNTATQQLSITIS